MAKKKDDKNPKKLTLTKKQKENIISTICGGSSPNENTISAEWVALASASHSVEKVESVVKEFGGKIKDGKIDLISLRGDGRIYKANAIIREETRKAHNEYLNKKREKKNASKPADNDKTANKQTKPAASSKTRKNVTPKPAGKSSEPKPAAPKKVPKAAAPKPINADKSSKDKLLIHNDKDEMNVGGEKPIILNAKNAKPKHPPKVLRKVAKTGGYTAWDDIKRNGKTFATEKEAKDYAADLLKKTGKVVLISPTDRQVTHTFKAEQTDKK